MMRLGLNRRVKYYGLDFLSFVWNVIGFDLESEANETERSV
jgi:hypothetical protein